MQNENEGRGSGDGGDDSEMAHQVEPLLRRTPNGAHQNLYS